MRRRILLVDDEVAVLLTLKAVLEISGFDVDTAASAREARSRIKTHQYQMVITDMRMESDIAGRDVILAARTAPYHPAIALLTAFPVDEEDWREFGADELLLKPTKTRELLEDIEQLLASHSAKLQKLSLAAAPGLKPASPAQKSAKKAPAKKAPAKKTPAKKVVAKKSPTAKAAAKKFAPRKAAR